MKCDKTSSDLLELYTNPWTVQLYVKLDNFASKSYIFRSQYNQLWIDSKGILYAYLPLAGTSSGEDFSTGITIKPGLFYNISLAFDGNGNYTVRVIDENGTLQKSDTSESSKQYGFSSAHSTSSNKFLLYGNDISGSSYNYTAVFDECRFWTKVLTDDMLLNNYNHTLSGSEDGLYLYYKLDEGITNQTIAYDYSKKGGVSNGNHGTIVNMNVTNDVPSENQLSISAITDESGSYTINGIPFSGDGSTYT